MSTDKTAKKGTSGFKPFIVILAVLIGISILIKLLLNLLM